MGQFARDKIYQTFPLPSQAFQPLERAPAGCTIKTPAPTVQLRVLGSSLCFPKAGFDKKRLFYTQGDYGLFQCSGPCYNETFENETIIRNLVEKQKDMRKSSDLLLVYPHCGKPLFIKLSLLFPALLPVLQRYTFTPHFLKMGVDKKAAIAYTNHIK